MFKSLFSKIFPPFLIVKEAKAAAKKITPNEQRLVDFLRFKPGGSPEAAGLGADGIDGGAGDGGAG